MKIQVYEGNCLCQSIRYTAKSEPINPHLCSCTICQKSSGALTVAWVEFPLESFTWHEITHLSQYQSSEKTKRCFCQKCSCLLGTLNEGYPNICLTIASLNQPELIIPNHQHSYKDSAPFWWKVDICST